MKSNIYHIRSILIMLSFCIYFKMYSQQNLIPSHYYMNPYLINPAKAGVDKSSNAYFIYRNQWAGVEGAPESQIFTLDGGLETERIGLGLTFFNDVMNVLGSTGGALTMNYEVSLSSKQSLRFGMSGLVQQNRIFFERIKVDDLTDPNLLSNNSNETNFDLSAGLAYQYNQVHIGFSINQMIQNEVTHKNSPLFQSLSYKNVRHYYSSFSYNLEVNDKWEAAPMIMVRTVEGLPSQFDANTKVTYNKNIWSALTYRYKSHVGLAFGLLLSNRYVFGYNFEIPTNDLRLVGGTTHEFLLGLRLGKPKHNQDGLKISEDHIRILDDQYRSQMTQIDSVVERNEEKNRLLALMKEALDSESEEIRELISDYESFKGDINSIKESMSDLSDDEDLRYFLVLGVFSKLENANLFQQILLENARMDTKVVPGNTSGTWYLIHVSGLKR